MWNGFSREISAACDEKGEMERFPELGLRSRRELEKKSGKGNFDF